MDAHEPIAVAIEPLGREHLDAMVAFVRANRRAFEQFNEPLPAACYGHQRLRAMLAACVDELRSGTTCCLVARKLSGRAIVGRAVMKAWQTEPVSATIAFQTDRLHLGAGVASALVGALIDVAERSGIGCLDAIATVDNHASLHILEKHGFRRLDEPVRMRLRRGVVDCVTLRLSTDAQPARFFTATA